MKPDDTGKITNTAHLVIRTLEGSRDAFTELVERYRDAACAVAYTYFGSFDDVQDAVQEAFIHSYTHLHQLKEPEKFGPWLRKITANLCITRLRKRKQEAVSLEDAEEPISSVADPEKAAARIIVQNALGSLSEDMRLTVTLCYINGYSHSEVAHFLDVPLETVRSRLKHAKRKLREEMIEMVEEVLHEDKPDEELVRRLIDLEIQSEKVLTEGSPEEAMHYCDDWLAAVQELNSSKTPEQLQEMIISFVEAEGQFNDDQQKAKTLEDLRAKSIEEIQMHAEAVILSTKGDLLLRSGKVDEAQALFRKSMELVNSLDDPELRSYVTHIEAMSLWHQANAHLDGGRVTEAKSLYERAEELFQGSSQRWWSGVAHAAVTLIEEVGEEQFRKLARRSAACMTMRKTDGVVEATSVVGGWISRPGGVPYALDMDVLWQLNALPKILDASVSPGESWSGGDRRFEADAFKTTITVVSKEERVEVAAGAFENCLLLEMVTVEDQLPESLPEDRKKRARAYLVGTRRIWFAPGVGVVQLIARNIDGDEAVIQLSDYTITSPSTDYFPLTIGNSWTYGWVGIPDEYAAKHVFKVADNERNLWYLESYTYAYRKSDVPN